MRQAAAMLMLCALILAPVIISVTHGPDPIVEAMQVDAVTAAHDHSHDWDESGKPGQHDATDHEHSLSVVLSRGEPSVFELRLADWVGASRLSAGMSGDSPRRPPRDSIV